MEHKPTTPVGCGYEIQAKIEATLSGRWKMIRKALLAGAILFAPALLLADSHMLRHPSYSKGKVAFSYLGDIWVANEDGSALLRLTDNKARDVYPRFSPDGAWVAFSSNRDGNNDV